MIKSLFVRLEVFHGGEDSSRCLLGCDAVYQHFQRPKLPPPKVGILPQPAVF